MVQAQKPSGPVGHIAGARSMQFLDVWPDLREEPTYVVLGVQGSGTNLLCRILHQAFGVSVTRDRSLICSAAARVARNPTRGNVARQMQRVYRSFFPGQVRRRLLSREFHHHSRNYLGVEEAIGKVETDSAASFAEFWYSYHAFSNELSRKGIKSDDIWRHVSDFDAILPNRRLVRLLRDPRDNALSITSKDWGPRNVLCAAKFVADQASIYDHEVASHPEHSLVIKYEHLLMETASFVERFAEQFDALPRDGWRDRLQKIGIRSENRQKWRSLPTATLEHLESRLGPLLSGHGYDRATPDGNRPSPMQMVAWRVDDIARRLPQKIAKTWRRRILGH